MHLNLVEELQKNRVLHKFTLFRKDETEKS